jgi:hypothetical protein
MRSSIIFVLFLVACGGSPAGSDGSTDAVPALCPVPNTAVVGLQQCPTGTLQGYPCAETCGTAATSDAATELFNDCLLAVGGKGTLTLCVESCSACQ